MIKRSHTTGIEINPKQVGVLLTDRVENTLRVFCFYTNGSVSQMDVEADKNLESQRALFSQLNIEPTCTSVVLDAAVQGRIYVQLGDQHWLYTMLNTPGNRLPLNAGIGDLPWEVIWRSSEMEVLRYQAPQSIEASFALRKKIIEGENLQLVKETRLFTDPVSPSQKPPSRRLHKDAGLILLAVAVVIAGVLIYASSQKKLSARSVSEPMTRMEKVASNGGGCLLLYNHRISGPFPAKAVANMEAAGLFSPDTMCRAENSTVWVKLAAAFPTETQKHLK